MKRSSLLSLAFLFLAQLAFSQDPARFRSEIDRFKADKTDYTRVEQLVLFTGSSTIRMWADLVSDFPDRHVLNRGFGGSHMSDLVFYADTLILQYKPVKVFIYEGDNDIAAGKGPEEILAGAAKLTDLIRKELPKTKIIFISAKPSIARWSMKNDFIRYNRLLEEFTKTRKRVYFLDTWNIMLDEKGNPRNDIWLEDGLHMNRKGYDIWRDAVKKIL
jgi:lysophospholipase L1-like esterase